MEKARVISIVLVLLMVAFIVSNTSYAMIYKGEDDSYEDLRAIDGTPIIQAVKFSELSIPDFDDTGRGPGPLTLFCPNYDFYKGTLYISSFSLERVGQHVAIWVAWDELTTHTGRHDFIKGWMLDYLTQQFDSIIYPIETECFGIPKYRNASRYTLSQIRPVTAVKAFYQMHLDEKIHVFVTNIRDENFYLKWYPYYIAGFVWTGLNNFMGMNILFIDSYDWQNRLGPNVRRPYLYERTLAHEYEHVIHNDCDPDEESWVDEGCAMLAEYVTYKMHDWADISFFLYTPDNSLTQWGDQGDLNILADYGAAYLWTLYLYDRFCSKFIYDLVHEPKNGVEGANEVLSKYAPGLTFINVFQEWTEANLLGWLGVPWEKGYTLIDLTKNPYKGYPYNACLRIYNITEAPTTPVSGSNFGTTKVWYYGFDTGLALLPMYGTDYIKFIGPWTESFTLNFDGDDYSPYGWKIVSDDITGSGNHAWYSTTGNLVDYSLYINVDLSAYNKAVLNFRTYFDMEPYWDYGFVQVSEDGGKTWISLTGKYTTYQHEADAHPSIVANLPGITGCSQTWVNEEMNLTAFAGKNIILRFRYMTDWAVAYPGWWIDDVTIKADETVIFYDNMENIFIIGMELTPEGYKITYSTGWYQYFPEVDFTVTVICFASDGSISCWSKMLLDDYNESGSMPVEVPRSGYAIIIISPTPTTIIGPVDYSFWVS